MQIYSNIILTSFVVFLIGFTGCSKTTSSEKTETTWSDDVKQWEKEGWRQEEVFGQVEDQFAYAAYAKSETANTLWAHWIIDGVKSSKEYSQNEKLYLILTYSKENGDSFVIVLSKPK